MPDWQGDGFRAQASKISNAVRGKTSRKKAVVDFAKKHDLIYFQSVGDDQPRVPVRGSTASVDQIDSNFCIGTHADYDMALVERTATVSFEGYKPTLHKWYVLQIDLKSAQNLPFIFVGTRQQTKAYYAKLFTVHRDLRYLTFDSTAERREQFRSHFVILASPAEMSKIYRLFTDTMIDTIATHNYPFAVEIEGDSLMVITEANKPSQQLLDKLLHYGLWMAKAVDQQLL